MTLSADLIARLEGSPEVINLSDGRVISYRHPTREQKSAAMAAAGISVDELISVEESGAIDQRRQEATARMARAYEILGAYCVVDISPLPKALEGQTIRERDQYGLLRLIDAAQVALDPMLQIIGEHLFIDSGVSEAEGEG